MGDFSVRRTLSTLFGLIAVLAAGCGDMPPADDEGLGMLQQQSLVDVLRIESRSDGLYDVYCKDGRIERGVTREKILKEDICNPPPAGDPFDPGSCTGAPLSVSEAVTKYFRPGETRANVGRYEYKARSRSCNSLSGCTAWSPITGHVVGLYTGTKLTGRADLEISSGNLSLHMYGDELAIGSAPSGYYFLKSYCSIATAGALGCSQLGALYRNSSGTSSIELSPSGSRPPIYQFSGLFTNHCLRLSAVDKNGTSTSWVEKQLAFLMVY